MSDWDDEIPQPIRERVKKSAASLAVAAQKVEDVRDRIRAIQVEAELALNDVKEGMASAIQQCKDAMFKQRISEERWGSALKLTGLNTAFTGAQYAAYAYFLFFLYFFGIFSDIGSFPIHIYYLLTSFKGIVFFIAPYFLMVRQSRRLAARTALKASFAHLDQTLAKAEVQISGNATTGKVTPEAVAFYPTTDGNSVGYYPPFVNDLVPPTLNVPGAVHILLTASSEKSQQQLKLGYKHNAHELIVSGDASLTKYPEFNHLIAAKVESIRPVMNTLADGYMEFKSVKDAYATCKTEYEKDLELAEAWSQIALPDETSNKLIKLIELFTSESDVSPKGILLYGPPGTGKTTIAKVLAKTGNLFFQEISESDLKGQYQGHTGPKVQAIFSELRKHQPAILFVDECEGVFKSRSSSNATGNVNFDTEMLKEFLVQWGGIASDSKTKILVIGATNLHENIDSAVMSRFTTRIEIRLPDNRCREKILRNEMKKAKLIVPDDLSKVIRDTTGFAGRDLETLVVSLAADLTGRNDPTEAEILKEIRLVRGKSSTDVLDQTWDDIVLPENIKNQFINLGKMLKSHEALKKSGIDVPSGALLWGPPGTGKTQLAKVLAGESGLGYIAASTAEIRKSNLGESGFAVKNLFERARSQSPCILFIDEIEILAPSRSGDQADSISTEIIGQLLQEMDGIKSQNGMVFVLAATNHPALLDSAVASRLEPKLELPLPDLATRTAILKIILKNKPIDFDLEHGAHQIALLTEGKSGRDLNTLVKGAGSRATTRALTTGELIDEENPVVLQLADITNQLDEAQEVVKVADLSWEDIVLPDSIKDQFVTLGKMLKNAEVLRSSGIDAQRGALLYGPPGTGKTQLARVLASQSGLSFFAPTTAELRQKYIGHSGAAVRDMFEKARKMSPCILFIDEIEILAPSRSGDQANSATTEIIGQLLQEMDGIKSQNGMVFVLAATNHPALLDSAVASRLEPKLELPLPDLATRTAILKIILKNKPIDFDLEHGAHQIALLTEGKSGRDLNTLVQIAGSRATRRALTTGELIDEANPLVLQLADITNQLDEAQEVVKVADLSWEDIVLPDSIKDQFVTLGKMLKNAEVLRSSGIDAPRSALLYGPPGTGKTQLARVLASQSGLSFFAPTTAELRQKYIGHSGAAVRDMFEKARKMSPCILFIDEMEILAGQRTGSDNEVTTEEIVGQFLQEMDGIKSQAGQVFVLGATNHPEFLDSAILSRFLQKIAIPLPELQARQAILKNLLRNKPVSADIDVIVLDLAAQTEGYSGRDLRNLVDGAASSATTRAMKSIEAIDPVNNPIRITKEDLMQALSARQVTQLA